MMSFPIGTSTTRPERALLIAFHVPLERQAVLERLADVHEGAGDRHHWIFTAVVALAALPGSLSREVVAVRATLFTTAMPIAAVWAIVPDTEAA